MPELRFQRQSARGHVTGMATPLWALNIARVKQLRSWSLKQAVGKIYSWDSPYCFPSLILFRYATSDLIATPLRLWAAAAAPLVRWVAGLLGRWAAGLFSLV